MSLHYLKDGNEKVIRKIRIDNFLEEAKRPYTQVGDTIKLNEKALLSEAAGVSVYSKSLMENRQLDIDLLCEKITIYDKDSNGIFPETKVGEKEYGLFDFAISHILESDYDTFIVEDFDSEDENILRAECHLLIHMRYSEGRSKRQRREDWNQFRSVLLNNANIVVFKKDIKWVQIF